MLFSSVLLLASTDPAKYDIIGIFRSGQSSAATTTIDEKAATSVVALCTMAKADVAPLHLNMMEKLCWAVVWDKMP